MPAFSPAAIPDPLRALVGPDTRLEFPAQGMTSAVAFFGDIVVKRCTDVRYRDWLRREHVVLLALGEVELPIPRVRGFVDRGDDVWLAITRLEGGPLPDALAIEDASGRARSMRELGSLLACVHAIEAPIALRDEIPWADRMLAQAGRNLAWCDGTPELLTELTAGRPTPQPETLVHGDLGLDNVLFANGHVSALIDWPMGGSGDPRIDVAIATEADEDRPFTSAELAAFWHGYGTTPPDPATMRWFRRLWDFF